MADESTRTDDAADADERASRSNGRSTSGDAVAARRARRGRERAGRPKRRPAEADGDEPAKAIERKHTTAPTRRSGGARKRTKEPAKRKRTTPWGFAKQSVDELKKVIWPSGQEVSQYFVVVLVFVVFVMAIVAGLDLGFTKLLLKLFG